MRYWLNKPWPVGQYVLPRATVIDSVADDQWSVIARGHVPPPDAIPLDDEALALMRQHYMAPNSFSAVFMGQA
jgi:hypothetical protein